GAFRCGDELGVMQAPVTPLVPAYANLSVVAVRGYLHHGAGAVFVEPAQKAHRFLRTSIAPKTQAIWFHGMDPKFGFFARADPLRPHVAHQLVRQQAELIGLFRLDLDVDTLGPEARLHKGHAIKSGIEVGIDCASRSRTHDRNTSALAFEFEQHV